MKRWLAVDRVARRLADEVRAGRCATFSVGERSDDPSFRHDVLTVFRRRLAGDESPLVDLEDD